jgi:NitT/TauT family transport system permease protein
LTYPIPENSTAPTLGSLPGSSEKKSKMRSNVSTQWKQKVRGGLKRTLIWLLLLTIWEAAYRNPRTHWRQFIFPYPTQVIDSTLGMLGMQTGFGEALHPGWPAPLDAETDQPPLVSRIIHSQLIGANVVSAVRLTVGFSISIVIGSILGTLMWRFEFLDEFLRPVFLGLQTLPSVCWVPLAVLVLGLNETGILFVLIMGSTFGIAISMRDGLRAIPPLYRRAGLMLGAHNWRLYRYVLFPASLPALASSLRQGFSFAWRSLMGAELILVADHQGLGFLLKTGEDSAQPAQVVSVMIVMVIIGMLADRFAFAPRERRVHTRFGLGART